MPRASFRPAGEALCPPADQYPARGISGRSGSRQRDRAIRPGACPDSASASARLPAAENLFLLVPMPMPPLSDSTRILRLSSRLVKRHDGSLSGLLRAAEVMSRPAGKPTWPGGTGFQARRCGTRQARCLSHPPSAGEPDVRCARINSVCRPRLRRTSLPGLAHSACGVQVGNPPFDMLRACGTPQSAITRSPRSLRLCVRPFQPFIPHSAFGTPHSVFRSRH